VTGRLVVIHPYDPAWPELFERERSAIVDALGDAAVRVEHTGSTAVPGLGAKPKIDITLVVPDSTDEDAYLSALEAAGYRFLMREPDWFEHRLLVRDEPLVNLHVFTVGCPEIDQMTGFRDWLRTHRDECDLYERVKRELAARDWEIVQDYADAKTDIVTEIKRRAGLLPRT
jgi:GrpB-like predicted nucleotidyltransferase (UPF0157 family)